MKGQKITNQNFRLDRKKNINTLTPEAQFHNDLVDDITFLMPVSGVAFTGDVRLDRSQTLYDDYTVDSNIEIGIDSSKDIIAGGYAELALIGDGSHAPTFASELLATPDNMDYDNTPGKLNKMGIYFDGNRYFRTLIVVDEP
jgi:hypothetical protein